MEFHSYIFESLNAKENNYSAEITKINLNDFTMQTITFDEQKKKSFI